MYACLTIIMGNILKNDGIGEGHKLKVVHKGCSLNLSLLGAYI